MCSGSSPSTSHAPRTSRRSGTSSSRSTMPSPLSRASSLSAVATPPRVGSRIQRTPLAHAPISASTNGHTERVSERRSASRSSSPRASRIVIPWSPIGPLSSTLSPARTERGSSVEPLVHRADAERRDVHAVAHAVLDDLRVAADDRHARARAPRRPSPALRRAARRSASPASRMNDAISAVARAPDTARSFTVPFTASSPIEPPGNRSGLTT